MARKSKWDKEVQALIVQLINLKVEFGKCGLYKTMHALDTATKVVGYEVAEEMALANKLNKKGK